MRAVFISYRREESAGEARALFNDLVEQLGDAAVFMDVDSIAPGQDFRDVVRQRLSSCDVLLALVGKDWLTVTNHDGLRRLDDPGDFVRLEIEAALKRNIPVAPVLLHGTEMPSASQLPEALRDFAYRNAFELSHTRWESDVHEMLRRLALLDRPSSGQDSRPPASHAGHHSSTTSTVGGTPVAPPAPAKRAAMIVAAVFVVAVLAVAAYAFLGNGRDTAAGEPPAKASEALPASEPPRAGEPAVSVASNRPAAAGTVAGRRAAAEATPGSTSPATPSPATAAATAAAIKVTAVVARGGDVSLGSQLSGADTCLNALKLGPCNGARQTWTIDPIGAGGRVRLHSAVAGPGKCLDVVNDGTNERLDLAACGDYAGQHWTIEFAGEANRFVNLRNDFTGPGKCMAIALNGGNAELRMARCANGPAQRWRLTPR